MTPSLRSLRRSPLSVALGALVLLTAAPSTAQACWDGHLGSVGGVSISMAEQEGAEWEPATARELARWGVRIDALLAPRTFLSASHYGEVAYCQKDQDGHCGVELGEARWSTGDLPALFATVVTLTGASPAAERRARALDAQPFTLQVIAARTRSRADALAARIHASGAGEHGFYEAGGFPAWNHTAHVVPGLDAARRPIFRVFVGAFLERREAVALGASLKKKLGIHGFARPL